MNDDDASLPMFDRLRNAPDGAKAMVHLRRPVPMVGGAIHIDCSRINIADAAQVSQNLTVIGNEVQLTVELVKDGNAWSAKTMAGTEYRYTSVEVNNYAIVDSITAPEPKKKSFRPGLYKTRNGNLYAITPRGVPYGWDISVLQWRHADEPLPNDLIHDVHFGDPSSQHGQVFDFVELRVQP